MKIDNVFNLTREDFIIQTIGDPEDSNSLGKALNAMFPEKTFFILNIETTERGNK